MFRRCARRFKGDFAAVIFHDSNPEIGAPYTNDDRRMRDDEFEDFLRSVKGWTTLDTGAIEKTFHFATPAYATQFMGRLMAFGYFSDRWPKLTWTDGTTIHATIYSGRFKGLTKHEARLAAFMNDHANLIRKAADQRTKFEARLPGRAAQQFATAAAASAAATTEARNEGGGGVSGETAAIAAAALAAAQPAPLLRRVGVLLATGETLPRWETVLPDGPVADPLPTPAPTGQRPASIISLVAEARDGPSS